MKTEIKAILYDADGVIINSYMAFSELLDKEYRLSLETTKDFFKGPFVDCLEGKLDMRDLLPDYLKKWKWSGSLDDFIDLWFKTEHSVEESVLQDADRLRADGIRCYVATDQEKHRADYMLEHIGFKDHFDGLYASSHLGVRKQDSKFFRRILDKIGLAPGQVLFWDDSQNNIDSALAVGLNAELFKSVEDYNKIMHKKYGL